MHPLPWWRHLRDVAVDELPPTAPLDAHVRDPEDETPLLRAPREQVIHHGGVAVDADPFVAAPLAAPPPSATTRVERAKTRRCFIA